MAKRGVTVKDVARESGFSLATCVHILGGREERYSERTVAAVQAVAKRLGYRRNAMARAMKTGRTHSIALLGSQQPIRGVLPIELLEALEAELSARELHLALARLSDDAFTAEGSLPRLLHEWACDGVLVNYQKNVPPALERLIDDSDLPAIWLNTKRSVDCVHPDELGGLEAATRRLIEHGHRRIAWADASYGALQPDSHFSVGDRFSGYQAAMRQAGLSPRALVPAGGGYLLQHLHLEAARAWAADPERPTAILATDPDVIASLIVAWRERGLEPPRDLSLVAVGPRRVVVIGQPVDTVLIPNHEMARQAVALLLRRVAEPGHLPAARIEMPYDPAGSVHPAPAV